MTDIFCISFLVCCFFYLYVSFIQYKILGEKCKQEKNTKSPSLEKSST